MTEFQDIRITELASGQAESGPLMNMVLNLSADASQLPRRVQGSVESTRTRDEAAGCRRRQ
ncbi:hypothetical protein ACCS70_35095 [Rhizobium ruizarguesonis]